MGTNLPPLSSSPPLPKASQELTINTSLWTANRNRIHTMNIFIINSSAFYKLFALYESLFIGHSSCDSWWSPLHYCPLDASPSIIAQEGPKAQGCVSWLWYKRDQLLVATAKCEGRAESGLILQINRKLHPGNHDLCNDEKVNVNNNNNNNVDKPLSLSLSLCPNISGPGRESKHTSRLVLICDLFYVNLRQSDSAISAFIFRWGGWNRRENMCRPTNSTLSSLNSVTRGMLFVTTENFNVCGGHRKAWLRFTILQ